MNGFIAITNDDWCSFLGESHSSNAVFWRKKVSFKALQKGEPFYFLNRKKIDGVRRVVGHGSFDNWEVLSASDAWNKYSVLLGFASEQAFRENVIGIYGSYEVDLGCILLNEVCFYGTGVQLETCDIEFSPYTVSGKTISDDERLRLQAALKRSKINGTD